MKTKPALSMIAIRLFGSSFAILATCVLAFAIIPIEGLRESESSQAQIKTQTQTISQQLESTIAEYERNGLAGGEEVKTLKAIRSVLGRLSGTQMQQVIDLLQQARTTSDEATATNHAAQAYSGQKGIIAQLKELLVQYQRQQTLYELSHKLIRLAERQDNNLSAAIDTVKVTIGKSFEQFDPIQRNALTVQRTEQDEIKTEVRESLNELRGFLDHADGEIKDRLAKAQSTADGVKLAELVGQAASDLGLGNIYRSATSQKIARDTLRDIARLVAPPENSLEQLKKAQTDLANAIEQQKQVIAQTSKIPEHNRKEASADAEKQQGKIVDRADTTRKDIQELAPPAAESIRKAQDKMQEARAALNSQNKDSAVARQTDAAKELDKAKHQLDEQIAQAEKTPPVTETPKDNLARTKKLLDQTKQLREEQKQLTQTPIPANQPNQPEKPKAEQTDPAKAQEKLAEKTRELEQKANDMAPEAGKKLDEAAKNMDQAQKSLEENIAAQEQQKAADTKLAEAQKNLEDQLKQMENAEADLAKAQEAQKQLADVIQDQQKLESETAKAALGDKQQTPQQMADEQKQIGQKAEQAKPQVPAGEAQKAMDQAGEKMSQSQKQLADSKPADARPNQQEAIKDLQQAKAAVDQKVEDLQKQLGKEPGAEDAMAKVSAELDKAQDAIAEAQKEMGNGEKDSKALDKASESLNKAAQAVAKASAEDQGKMAQSAQESLQKAHEALSDGQAQAKARQAGEAMKNSQKAQEALAQAQASVQLAQNGMKPTDNPMETQQISQKSDQKSETKGKSMDPKDAGTDRKGDPDGQRDDNKGTARFLGLPARDRAAIVQSQAEKYPQEYGPAVEQYLRNLSDEGK